MIHYKKCCKVYWFYKEYTRGTPTRKKSRYFIKKKSKKTPIVIYRWIVCSCALQHDWSIFQERQK